MSSQKYLEIKQLRSSTSIILQTELYIEIQFLSKLIHNIIFIFFYFGLLVIDDKNKLIKKIIYELNRLKS